MKLDLIMNWLTTAVFVAFAVFGYMWWQGSVQGNFSALLMAVTAVTGLYWLAERFYFLPKRIQAAEAFAAGVTQKTAHLAAQGITKTDTVDVAGVQQDMLQQPWWLDWTAGLFPVIAIVFAFRSFVFEPFKIPSGSMIPTLYIGDLIVVNKFTYGVKVPVFNQRLTDGKPVARGDVVVFRYPPNPSLDYIKRVIGLPGDEVSYINKELKINGVAITKKPVADFFDPDTTTYTKQFEEALDGKPMRLLNFDVNTAFGPLAPDQPFMDQCRYSVQGVVCKVPAGHYFAMGDNRDNSTDSRFWGFVPEGNIVGKASAIWMNFSHLSRAFSWIN